MRLGQSNISSAYDGGGYGFVNSPSRSTTDGLAKATAAKEKQTAMIEKRIARLSGELCKIHTTHGTLIPLRLNVFF